MLNDDPFEQLSRHWALSASVVARAWGCSELLSYQALCLEPLSASICDLLSRAKQLESAFMPVRHTLVDHRSHASVCACVHG